MSFPFSPTLNPCKPLPDDPRLRNCGHHLDLLQPAHVPYRNKFFSVVDRAGYFTLEVESHDVVIIPVVDECEIVMLRPFRPVLGDAPLEFPGGGGDIGERPVETAARELFEETGLKITDLNRFRPRTPFCLSPNRMPRLHHVFEISITRAEADRMKADGDEIFSIERYAFEDAKAMVAEGTIYVAAVAGLLASLLFSREREPKSGESIS